MKTKIYEYFIKGLIFGLGFSIAITATTVIAITVSATFTAGEPLTASSLNALKSAIESIPGWAKGTASTNAVYNDGNVGIGMEPYMTKLEVQGSIGMRALQDPNSSGTADWTPYPILNMARSRGSVDSPTAVQAGDWLGGINAVGYDGSEWDTGAGITFKASENWSSSGHGTEIVFNQEWNDEGEVNVWHFMKLTDSANLQLGQSVAPKGITLFDIADGSEHCLRVNSDALDIVSGACTFDFKLP